jgi:glucose/arabinose dehydrogenase
MCAAMAVMAVIGCKASKAKVADAGHGTQGTSTSGTGGSASSSGQADGSKQPDAATTAAGTPSHGDAGKTDAGKTDTSQMDAGQVDMSRMDAGKTDAGKADAGKADADAGKADAGKVSDTCTTATPYTAYVSDPQLCVSVFAQNLGAARQMAFAPNGDLFVNNGSVIALWDADHNGTSDSGERATFASASGLGHGIAFSRDGTLVYASSQTTVYRWAYETGSHAAQGSAEVVIANIPSGGHTTRTLAFDSTGRLYVSIGSSSNVDDTQQLWDTRGQVRRYTLPGTIPQGGLDYAQGDVVASGMRNEVGLFFDAQDRLWGVENGRDDLSDTDFGGDIHNDNPGEEINLVDGSGSSFYGYPFCYSEGKLTSGNGAGSQWADQTLDTSIRKTDVFCQDAANVHRPMFVMQAHWAPLGIIQYTGQVLPFNGDFIVTSHGSWDRQPAVGRVLARAHYQNGAIVSVDVIVGQRGASAQELQEGNWDARPVDVRQGPDQALYFSDDQGGRVFKVGHH